MCVACGALAPLQAEGGAAAGCGGCWGAAGSKEGCEGGRGRGWERLAYDLLVYLYIYGSIRVVGSEMDGRKKLGYDGK